MKTMETRFTLRDWMALPEGFPAQLFDGQLVREPAPSYRHQDLVGQLYLLLVPHFGRHLVVLAPADVVIDTFTVLQPDVAVLREEPPQDSHNIGIPVVVFEVLSPSTAVRDKTRKVQKYLGAGVEEVWIVDPGSSTIEVRTPRGARTYRGGEPANSDALPALSLSPDQVFTRD